MTQRINVKITVTAVEDEEFPIWLRFTLIDRHGVSHEFVEKAPVLFEGLIPDKLPATSILPCSLLQTFENHCLISTETPFGISSLCGVSEFELLKPQIHSEE